MKRPLRLTVGLAFLLGATALAQPEGQPWAPLHEANGHGQKDPSQPIPYALSEPVECARGRADIFSCKRVDLLGHVDLSEVGADHGNDVWGWYDPRTGREYALMGHSQGTAFVDVSDPTAPVVVASLPTETIASGWRDIKVYRNWALVVADFAEEHGVQIFNLRRLRHATPPQRFSADRVYSQVGTVHNIVVDEATAYAYAVGSTTCRGGLHMIDIRRPLAPAFAGCFSGDNYTHDAQCVVYDGPDEDYRGHEVCFAANLEALTLVDVSDKSRPRLISRSTYEGAAYAHQGWLSEDHAWFFLDDENDELVSGAHTRTLIWNVSDLDRPTLAGQHFSDRDAIDHNQYVRGNLLFQANYTRGLQVLRLHDPTEGELREVARFDSHPESDLPQYNGAWSVYPFLPSGTVLLNDMNRGLFVLRLRPLRSARPTP